MLLINAKKQYTYTKLNHNTSFCHNETKFAELFKS